MFTVAAVAYGVSKRFGTIQVVIGLITLVGSSLGIWYSSFFIVNDFRKDVNKFQATMDERIEKLEAQHAKTAEPEAQQQEQVRPPEGP
ncbi:MAG: hypothetical protein HQ592_14265 [Planctomycetes bacterium]|nr:hypothetical protein [Planctomycetota bacterium]